MDGQSMPSGLWHCSIRSHWQQWAAGDKTQQGEYTHCILLKVIMRAFCFRDSPQQQGTSSTSSKPDTLPPADPSRPAGARRTPLNLNPVATLANGSSTVATNTASTKAITSSTPSVPPSALFQPGDVISNSSSSSSDKSSGDASASRVGAVAVSSQHSSSGSNSSSGYKLEALAHSGPRSNVWRATRLADGSLVAVKVRE